MAPSDNSSTVSNFSLEGRFRPRRRLGAGGSGVVYSAHDQERDELVAVKQLNTRDAAALYRFKREFRALADVNHPNLVALYELVVDDDDPFYTMELIEGESFLDHVRPHGELDVERLRMALAQLASGVHALHEADKIHCDLKPNNVLVRNDDHRVVILDFGVARSLAPSLSPKSMHQGFAGTAIYMSPEQAAGQELQAGSDWYSVGVMLYEALTGGPPFDGPLVEVLTAKAKSSPPPVDPRHELPADLVALCQELLARDPAERPSGIEILVRLGEEAAFGDSGRAPGLGIQALIGRGDEIATLRSAFAASHRGEAVTVYVHGDSGMGKSAFVEAFLRELVSSSNALVLAGHCHEREQMPYKALDGVVDSLSRYLTRLKPLEVRRLLPENVRPLGRLFPVLLRLAPFAAAARSGRELLDAPTLRRQAVSALRELLGAIAQRQPLILFIDDLHWADADSTLLLGELMHPPGAPPLMLVCSFRSEELQRKSFLRELLEEAGTASCQEVRLGPLGDNAAAELTRALLWGHETSPEQVENVVREAAGSPFFIEMLTATENTEDLRVDLAEMLRARLAGLPAGATELMTTVAVAGRPMAAVVAYAAAGLEGDERPLIAALKKASLLRSSGSAEELELYHGRLRQPLLQIFTPDEEKTAQIHNRLVQALWQRGRDDPEALYAHLLAAGDKAEAAVQALRAARKANRALAFDRAVLFYRRVLELGAPPGTPREMVQRDLATALADVGRPREAAAAFLQLAEEADAFEALRFRHRAAEELLAGGYLEEGLKVIEQVSVGVGLGRLPNSFMASISLLWNRLRLRLRGLNVDSQPRRQIREEDLLRVDTRWVIASSLSTIEPLRAANFQTHYLLDALWLGEPVRLVRALTLEASRLAINGPTQRRRVQRLLSSASDLASSNNPHSGALCLLHRGITAYLFGEWQDGRDNCSQAKELVLEKAAGGARELNIARRFDLSCRLYLGEIRGIRRRVPRLVETARERGDVQAACELATRLHAVWLFDDDPEHAAREIKISREAWAQAGFHAPHFNAWQGLCQIALYSGDSATALKTLDEGWKRLRRSLILRVQLTRSEALSLRGRVSLASGGPDAAAPPEHRRLAHQMARRLRREKAAPYAQPFADLLEAAVLSREADSQGAARCLQRARKAFGENDMNLHAAVASTRYGELVGGDEGEAALVDAEIWMSEQGIVRPTQICNVLAPGFPPGHNLSEL